jgi:hypothetical protein
MKNWWCVIPAETSRVFPRSKQVISIDFVTLHFFLDKIGEQIAKDPFSEVYLEERQHSVEIEVETSSFEPFEAVPRKLKAAVLTPLVLPELSLIVGLQFVGVHLGIETVGLFK